MTDDDEMSRERICCCQPCHHLLVKLGLLELNTSMLASLLSFDSRRYQLQRGESTASPSQHAQDEPSPVLPDYMLTTERPATSSERMMMGSEGVWVPKSPAPRKHPPTPVRGVVCNRYRPAYRNEISWLAT